MPRRHRATDLTLPARSPHVPPSLADVHRYATQALELSPRIVQPGQPVHVVEEGGALMDSSYRVRAIGSDALVIQRDEHVEARPFAGLLISRSHPGWPPRVLYDMGPLREGTAQMHEACRMLHALVRHASLV